MGDDIRAEKSALWKALINVHVNMGSGFLNH
jgi:hypothetical protein